jgi:hypothetical protein
LGFWGKNRAGGGFGAGGGGLGDPATGSRPNSAKSGCADWEAREEVMYLVREVFVFIFRVIAGEVK